MVFLCIGIHDNIAHEIIANRSESYAEELWNYNNGEVQEILSRGNLTSGEIGNLLETVGAKFRRDVILADSISKDTEVLDSAQKALKDVKGTKASPYVSNFLNKVIEAKNESIKNAKKEQNDITKKYGN